MLCSHHHIHLSGLHLVLHSCISGIEPAKSRNRTIPSPHRCPVLPFFNCTHSSPVSALSPTPGNHDSVLHFYNVVIPQMLHKWPVGLAFFFHSARFSGDPSKLLCLQITWSSSLLSNIPWYGYTSLLNDSPIKAYCCFELGLLQISYYEHSRRSFFLWMQVFIFLG